MKNFLLLFVLVFAACKPVHKASEASANDSGNLVGQAYKSDFLKKPFSEWFTEEYNTYTPDTKVLKRLKPLVKNMYIKVAMGTWCSDSQREVPRFYKILDALGFDDSQIRLIAVNRKKTTPNHETDAWGIERVPTFIFYKNGKELNRIVEYPIESLEKDWLQIAQGKNYKHAYSD